MMMIPGRFVGPVLFLALLVPARNPAGAAQPGADQAFQQLKGLVGDWESPLPEGRRLRVTYRLFSADTVLLETFGTARPTLTAYHLDGDRLLATHYCAQGNQPRLRLVSPATGGRLVFEFRDATSLSKGASHLRRLELDLVDSDHFTRSETYRSGQESQTTTYSFARVGAGA
jgi:hypothetical protein